MYAEPRRFPAARVALAGLVLGSVGWASTLLAQPADPDVTAPPFIAALEGAASMVRNGEVDELTLNMPLVDGDRLRTGGGGRLEILWVDGQRLWLDEGSTLDLVGPDLVRLVEGRLRLRSSDDPNAISRVETAAAVVRTVTPSDVIVAVVDTADRRSADVAVVSGGVRLVTHRGDVPLGRGERAVADAFGPAPVAETWDLAWRDAFLAWADLRVDESRAVAAADYLPETLQTFSGTLERYGQWQVEPTYGPVWYPAVDTGWAPYTAGSWRRVGFYGSVWIGVDPWAWPTHHYGRWGLDPFGRWYWIPAHRWSPGWVSWVVGPGYVGWAPLGWYDRPVVGWGAWGVVGTWSRPYAPWRGWTVVPSNRFWARGRVGAYAVDIGRFDRHQRSAFVTQRVAPAPGRVLVGGRRGPAAEAPRDAFGRQRVPSSGRPAMRPPSSSRSEPGSTPQHRVWREGGPAGPTREGVRGTSSRRLGGPAVDAPRDASGRQRVPAGARAMVPPPSGRGSGTTTGAPPSRIWRQGGPAGTTSEADGGRRVVPQRRDGGEVARPPSERRPPQGYRAQPREGSSRTGAERPTSRVERAQPRRDASAGGAAVGAAC
jgi:hypothetical protein